MGTTARSRLRAILAQEDGFYFSGTTTSAGSTSTLVDTAIPRFDSTMLVNKWVYMTSGAAIGESRRITSVSSTTVTFVTAMAQITGSGSTYEILPFNPDDCHYALQASGRLINQYTALSLVDTSLIVDNLLLNSSLDTFSSTFTSWTNIGTPTLAAETDRKVHGTGSAKITATGGTEGIKQNLFTSVNINEIVGKLLQVRGWVWASVASAVRIRVTFDGSTYTNGPWHRGRSEWEGPNIQTITVAVPTSGVTEMTVSCEVTDTNVGYFDLMAAWIDPVYRYTVPTTFVFPSPLKVFQQVNVLRPIGDYRPLSLKYPPIPGRILRLVGPGRIGVPTTDAGGSELDEAASELLIALAGRILHRTMKNEGFGASERQAQLEADWKEEVRELANARGLNRPQELIAVNRSAPWDVVEEAGLSYLILKGR